MRDPYGITLFCDDIRAEVGGKLTYVGHYTGDLIVHSNAPAVLPKLVAVTQLVIPAEFHLSALRLLVTRFGPASKDRVYETNFGAPPDATKGRDFIRGVFPIVLTQFELPENCSLRVDALFDDLMVNVGLIEIRFQPEAVA